MNNLSISVCIPCSEKHTIYLVDCLNSITEQTHKPNEVIICISGISDNKDEFEKKKKDVEMLLRYYPELNIKVDFSTKTLYAGENRNKAVSMSTGQIITFIDADDIMRCDRLYVLHKIFSLNSNTMGVIHKFYENEDIPPNKPEINFDKNDILPYLYSDKLHFGHASFRREIFNKYKYSNKQRGQDIEFVHNLLEEHISNLVIYNQKLTYYMSERSTFYSLNL